MIVCSGSGKAYPAMWGSGSGTALKLAPVVAAGAAVFAAGGGGVVSRVHPAITRSGIENARMVAFMSPPMDGFPEYRKDSRSHGFFAIRLCVSLTTIIAAVPYQ